MRSYHCVPIIYGMFGVKSIPFVQLTAGRSHKSTTVECNREFIFFTLKSQKLHHCTKLITATCMKANVFYTLNCVRTVHIHVCNCGGRNDVNINTVKYS